MVKIVSSIFICVLILGGNARAAPDKFFVLGSGTDAWLGNLPQNISLDQTKKFEILYGSHDPRDQIMADLSLYLTEGLLALAILLALFETKREKLLNVNIICKKPGLRKGASRTGGALKKRG